MNKETTDLEKLASIIKNNKFTMLSTVSDDGTIHSRPMALHDFDVKNFDGILWFFSKKNSFKNQDIETDQHVNLAFTNSDKQHYISVCGKALVSEDKKKMRELWNPALKTWFPEGLDDPELSLIGVNLESAEIWNSPSTKVIQVVNLVKSAVTGKPHNQDIHDHINLQSH